MNDSPLENRDDQGLLVFNIIAVGKSCGRCNDADLCMHPSINQPAWKAEIPYFKPKAIFGDRATMLKREIIGLVADNETPALRAKL